MDTTRHIAESLLREAHSPSKASAIFTEKVLHKPLHLRPTSLDPTSQDARAQRRILRLRKQEKKQRRQKVKPLSAKENRVSGIYEIPISARKYQIYEPLYKMWLGYIWEILGLKEDESAFVTAQSAGSKLASADYHGAKLSIVKSRCSSMVGLEGIVVRDTKFTFQIITKKNELKTIPKRYTVFRFDIPQSSTNDLHGAASTDFVTGDNSHHRQNLLFELHGSQFEHRAPERATKKFKQRNKIGL